MRIGALSRMAGLPVGTVKFYLRSGLLPHGRATGPTQAQYDESHLQRLRLIRALLEVGRMPLADIQRVLDAVDLPAGDPSAQVALVRGALAPTSDQVSEEDLAAARRTVQDLGWHVAEDSAWLAPLARALSALRAIGVEVPPESLVAYAESAVHAARHEGRTLREAEPDRRPTVAAAAVLVDALLVSLRRLAAEHLAAERVNVPTPRMSLPGA